MNYYNVLNKIGDEHPDKYRRNWARVMYSNMCTAGGKEILKRTGELDDDELNHYLKEIEDHKSKK